MSVSFVTRYYDRARGGLGRYEQALYPHLKREVGAQLATIQPIRVPRLAAKAGLAVGRDLCAVATNYPCVVPITRHYDGVVHLANQTMGLSLYLRRSGRWVVTVHDIFPYIQLVTGEYGGLRGISPWNSILYRLSIRGLRRADQIIADSEHTKHDLQRYAGVPPERVDVVPLGVDLNIFRTVAVPDSFRDTYGLRSDRRYLLYVGSQDIRKNLPTLFTAVEQLRRQLPDVRLLIVGAARLRPDTKTDVGLENGDPHDPSVRLLGHLPEDDLVKLYCISQALVFPSVYEGFGLPVLEAMACGCPVIAAQATSLPEVVGDAGWLVEPLNPDSWIQAISTVLEDRNTRLRLIEAGLSRAQCFPWENTASQTVAVYKRLGA